MEGIQTLPLLLCFVGLLALAAIAVFAKVGSILIGAGRSDALPYQRRKALFSKAERSFLGCLEAALEGRLRVFGKVRIEDLISVRGVSGSRRASARGRIKSRHVDFALCCPDSLEVLAVIELDDASHKSPKSIEADRWKSAIFKSAGLPLLRFAAKRAYSLSEIEAALSESLGERLEARQVTSDVVSKIPDSIGRIEEFGRIFRPYQNEGSFVLSQAPSVELKSALKANGYRARKVDCDWVWSRN
ncbi:MAG: DUF2726 domain-containing protein [Verrucomicrobiota bacterium]